MKSYIEKAAENAAYALTLAARMECETPLSDPMHFAIEEMVGVLNMAAIKLLKVCQGQEYALKNKKT